MNIQSLIDFIEEAYVCVNFLATQIKHDTAVAAARDSDDIANEPVFNSDTIFKIKNYVDADDIVMLLALYYNLKDKIDLYYGDYTELFDTLGDDIKWDIGLIISDISESDIFLKKNINIRYIDAGAEKQVYSVNDEYAIKAPDYVNMYPNPIYAEIETYKNAGSIRKYLPKLYGVGALSIVSAFEYLDGRTVGIGQYIENKNPKFKLPFEDVEIDIFPVIIYQSLVYSSQGMSFLDDLFGENDIFDYASLSLSRIEDEVKQNLLEAKNIIRSAIADIIDHIEAIGEVSKENDFYISDPDLAANTIYDFLLSDLKYRLSKLNHNNPIDIRSLEIISRVLREYTIMQSRLVAKGADFTNKSLTENGKKFTTLFMAFCIRYIFEDPVLTGLYDLSYNVYKEYDDGYMDLDMYGHNIILVNESEHGVPFKIIDFGGFARELY